MFITDYQYQLNKGTEETLQNFKTKYQLTHHEGYEVELYTNDIKQLELIKAHLIPSLYFAIIENKGEFIIETHAYYYDKPDELLDIKRLIILEINKTRFILCAD
jgi:hypothetical protein